MSSTPIYTLVGINYWPEPSGNAPYNSDLVEELVKNGSVRVVTGVPHYPWWEKLKDHSDKSYLDQHKNLELKRVNHYVPKKQSNFSRARMEIDFGLKAILFGRIKSDIVILVSPAMISSAMALAWLRIFRRKTKVILWVQDLYEQGLRETGSSEGFLQKNIFKIENWLLSKAHRVVMAHPRFLEVKGFELDGKKFFAQQNWSQFDFRPVESSDQTRAKYLLSGEKIVLHIGNMGVKQGLESVIFAAREALNSAPNLRFVFLGGGNQLQKLRGMSADLENVTFIAPVSEEELANLLNCADILLVHEAPGVKEMSIPSKLTTYFLSGKPVVVCSEEASLAGRTVLENNTGFWVQSGNPGALASKLNSLDLDEMDKVAAFAKTYADRNLQKSEALANFIRIIEEAQEIT